MGWDGLARDLSRLATDEFVQVEALGEVSRGRDGFADRLSEWDGSGTGCLPVVQD